MRAVIVLVVLAGTAFANPKAAAVHDRQAKAYFEAKQYDAAIDEFKKSYALVAKPITLFKIASAYYAKGDYASAIDYYQRYLQADPEGPYAAQAVEFTTIAKKALDDERAKRAAAEAEARKAEDAKRAAEEAERKQIAAAAHIKNAEAFAEAGAWSSAGDEYRAAAEVAGDPAHLLVAAAAYRKQPDHAKAADAYRAYLAKVPLGGKSDEARAQLADSVRALEQDEEAKRVAAMEAERRDRADAAERRKGPPPVARGWSSYGPRAAFGVSQGDTNPLGVDGSAGAVLEPSFDIGAFARYQLTSRIAVRPEVSIVYRGGKFDEQGPMGQIDAVAINRGGLSVAGPIYVSLQERDGFRLGVGPFVAALPVTSVEVKPGIADPGDAELLDYGVLAVIEIDFGLVALDVRFSKGFGKLASDFDVQTYTLLGGLAFGFGPD